MDVQQADIPTFEQFERYFLYIGYDVINEKVMQQQPDGDGGDGGGKGMQYKRFVQSNKNTDWAREIIDSVSSVQASRNHYKSLLPMLLNRNMTSLHGVCMDVIACTSPPHREVHGVERCRITGVLHERCIDVSRGGRSSAPPAEDASGGTRVASSSYISPRFKHFVQMLWTISKLDTIIKNYTIWWLGARFSHGESRQSITTRFGNESVDFCSKLYRIFSHGVEHVCGSLVDHMYSPMFSSMAGGGGDSMDVDGDGGRVVRATLI